MPRAPGGKWSFLVPLMLVGCLVGCGAHPVDTPQRRPLESAPPPAEDTLGALANRDLAKRDTDAARKRAHHALSVDPDNADAYRILGVANWLDGRIADSSRELKQALDREPLHFAASLALARNFRAVGDVGGSRHLLESLIAADREQELPWIGLLDTVWVGGDLDTLSKVAREALPVLRSEPPALKVANLFAALGKLLEGTGPWCTLVGTRGEVPRLWGDDLPLGIVAGEASGTPVRVSTNWSPMLARVTPEWLEVRGLATQGSVRWVDGEQVGIVVIPRIELGDIALERIPAVVLAKGSPWRRHGADVVLGRRALTAFGSIRMNTSEKSAEFSREHPVTLAEDAIVLPLLFLSGDEGHPGLKNTLATLLRLSPDGPETAFYLGAYPDGLVLTDKTRLRGNIPDADTERVKLPHVYAGDRDLGLTETILLESGRADATIDMVRASTSLELRGSLNPSALEDRVVTYAPSSRQLILEPAAD